MLAGNGQNAGGFGAPSRNINAFQFQTTQQNNAFANGDSAPPPVPRQRRPKQQQQQQQVDYQYISDQSPSVTGQKQQRKSAQKQSFSQQSQMGSGGGSSSQRSQSQQQYGRSMSSQSQRRQTQSQKQFRSKQIEGMSNIRDDIDELKMEIESDRSRRQQQQQQRRRVAEALKEQNDRLRAQLKDLSGRRTEKEFWEELQEAMGDLASQGLPITMELARSARNALVQEFGHTPEEANVLLNLRFRDYYNMSAASSQPSAAAMQQSQRADQKSAAAFAPLSQQTRQLIQQSMYGSDSDDKVRAAPAGGGNIAISDSVRISSRVVPVYASLKPAQQKKFVAVAEAITKYTKKQTLNESQAKSVRALVLKGPSGVKPEQGARAITVPPKYNKRPTEETQLARVVAHIGKKRSVGDAEYKAAKSIASSLKGKR